MLGATRGNPRIRPALHEERRVAGRERRLARQHWRQTFRRYALPRATAVGASKQEPSAIHRIAENQTVPVIPERHTVQERAFFECLEDERPALSTIRCAVDAGLAFLRISGAH